MQEKNKLNLNKVGFVIFVVLSFVVLATPLWLYKDYVTTFPEHCSEDILYVLVIGLLLGIFLYLFMASLLLNDIDAQIVEIRKKLGVPRVSWFEKVRK